jgi:hypothetical protein
MGWSRIQRSPTERGVSKTCHREASIVKRPRPPRGCRAIKKKLYLRVMFSLVIVSLKSCLSDSLSKLIVFHRITEKVNWS